MRNDAIFTRRPFTFVSASARQTAWRAATLAATFALGLLLPTLVFRPLAASPVPGILDLFVRPGFYVTDMAVLVVILLGLASWRGGSRLRGQANLIAPLLAVAGLAFLTAPLALSPALAGYTALRWALAALLFVALVAGDLPTRGLLAGLLAGVGINALLAIAQVAVQAPLGLPGELTLPRAVSGAAVIGAERWLRPYGLTFHPNVLGGLLVVALLLLLPQVRRTVARLLWWLCWAALLLAVSRSAWIALAVTLPLAAGWLYVKSPALRRPLLVTSAGSLLIAVILLATLRPVFQARLAGGVFPAGQPAESTARSVNERLALQSVALGIVAGRPLTGVGAGNTPLAIQSSRVDATPQPIHNLPLLVASEVGVLGGGLWIWLCLAPLAMLLARWHSRRGRPVSAENGARGVQHNAVLLTAALAWVALGVIGLFDFYPWGLESGRLLSVVTLALFARAYSERSQGTDSPGQQTVLP